ncbi:MAG: hypothetical protein U0V70_05080 [Terriglobia bacterium]
MKDVPNVKILDHKDGILCLSQNEFLFGSLQRTERNWPVFER